MSEYPADKCDGTDSKSTATCYVCLEPDVSENTRLCMDCDPGIQTHRFTIYNLTCYLCDASNTRETAETHANICRRCWVAEVGEGSLYPTSGPVRKAIQNAMDDGYLASLNKEFKKLLDEQDNSYRMPVFYYGGLDFGAYPTT